MKIEYSAKSVSGLVRDRNEDAFLCLPEIGLFVVADGMGGHNRGDVASKLCVEAIRDWFESKATPSERDGKAGFIAWDKGKRVSPRKVLAQSIRYANQSIFDTSRTKEDLAGMGTTVVALLVYGGMIYIVNSGDSRAYRLRMNTLHQVTRDHSLVAEYLRLHLLTRTSARVFPYRNVIVKALGLSSEASFDMHNLHVRDDDLYLLCSDGLTEMVDDQELRALLSENEDLEVLCDRLVEAALEAGGIDNITVVLVRCRVNEG
jgi:protein phosphatase